MSLWGEIAIFLIVVRVCIDFHSKDHPKLFDDINMMEWKNRETLNLCSSPVRSSHNLTSRFVRLDLTYRFVILHTEL